MSLAERPFAVDDGIEITLDLPMPPSTNRLWRHGKGRVYKSSTYVKWIEAADMAVMAHKQFFPRRKTIRGAFTMELLLSEVSATRSDADNRIKAALDWCQSRGVIDNDLDCREGRWRWVGLDDAPAGCRIILRSWHGN